MLASPALLAPKAGSATVLDHPTTFRNIVRFGSRAWVSGEVGGRGKGGEEEAYRARGNGLRRGLLLRLLGGRRLYRH
jgi:hypothetical protein